MKNKIAALSLSLIFFGTITFSGLAMTTGLINTSQVIDNDKDKKQKSLKKANAKVRNRVVIIRKLINHATIKTKEKTTNNNFFIN